jgi:hypothetical protein
MVEAMVKASCPRSTESCSTAEMALRFRLHDEVFEWFGRQRTNENLVHGLSDEIRSREPYGNGLQPPASSTSFSTSLGQAATRQARRKGT